jgi:hypothetical protein
MHGVQRCIAAINIAPQQISANINRRGGSDSPVPDGCFKRGISMIFSNLVKHARSRLEKRVRYSRLVAEIEGLTSRDLADMGADRGDMLRHAYRDVYGR